MPSCLCRPGFSFAEVMFAVIILGIGFIMVAAMFPVAIQQSKLTVDESTAAGIARAAVNYVDAIASNATLPPTDLLPEPTPNTDDVVASGFADIAAGTLNLLPGKSWNFPGKVVSFRDLRINGTPPSGAEPSVRATMWNAVRGNLIFSADSRFAWVPLYRRDQLYRNDTDAPRTAADAATTRQPSGTAQVILIPVQVQNRTNFDSRDVRVMPTDPTILNLQPRPLLATTPAVDANGDDVLGTIAFTDQGGADIMPGALGALAEGTYVVISQDRAGLNSLPPSAQVDGHFNGRVYRLGVRRQDLDSANGASGVANVWEFAPGADFRAETVRTAGPDLEFGTTDDVNVNVSRLVGATVLAIGRGFADPTVMPTAAAGFEGNAMDIASYVTFVKVK